LRVALVHPYCWPDVRRGGERYLADLAWYLGRAGHLVEELGQRHPPPHFAVRRQFAVVREELRRERHDPDRHVEPARREHPVAGQHVEVTLLGILWQVTDFAAAGD